MKGLRQHAIVVAVGAASILSGLALILNNQPIGRALMIAGSVGLIATLTPRR